MEKLVEEIAKKIWAIHAFPRGETDWDRAVEQARLLITRIGKAYADGMPLPDEVGRIIFHGIKEGQRLEDLRFKMGDTLIALRKEGQEEGGCLRGG